MKYKEKEDHLQKLNWLFNPYEYILVGLAIFIESICWFANPVPDILAGFIGLITLFPLILLSVLYFKKYSYKLTKREKPC
jgi:hypothetical protein